MKLSFRINELWVDRSHPDKGCYPCCWCYLVAIGYEYIPISPAAFSNYFKKL